MTTFSYTLELDDGERSTLGTALAMLKNDCLEQMEATPGAPYKARLRNIERIQKKLDVVARKTSGIQMGDALAKIGRTLGLDDAERPLLPGGSTMGRCAAEGSKRS